MHHELTRFLGELEAHFRSDGRCLGVYLLGSVGRGTDDDLSDIDVAAVVRDEAYPAVTAELRPLCERLAGPIAAWLPEGESPGFCNYAFLFEAGSDVLLCDAEIISERVFRERRLRPDRILFDPTGLLQDAAAAQETSRRLTAEGLARDITTYWVYLYLNGKYYRRADLDKLLYVQSVLFRTHLRVLNALDSDAPWRWWADDIKRLSDEQRRELLAYFPAPDLRAIPAALADEADLFARDARAACDKWGVAYSHEQEDAVRCHLQAFGVLPVEQAGGV